MAENTVTMEIIDSEQYKRANIRFNGKPSEEIREELKKEGWFYSRNHNVWIPIFPPKRKKSKSSLRLPRRMNSRR